MIINSQVRSCLALAVLLPFAFTACSPKPNVPNQPNAQFELTAFKTLVTAQSSLMTLSAASNNAYVQHYKPQLNQAITMYNTTQAAFALYVQQSAGTATASEITTQEAQLAGLITQLILDFTQPLDPAKANALATGHAQPQFNLSTLLEYLQVAASVASEVPATAVWGSLAAVVLNVARTALAANQAATSVNLATLQQLPLIS